MSFEVDEEILQDFLVEAGEILEQLSEQLVDLERNPDDIPLLNSIFRGFHTVKGGAGFLQFNALVNCCHYAENVFDILRNGQRSVTPELMDVVLQALDAVNEMFDAVRAGGDPEPADPEIIKGLSKYAEPPSENEEEVADEEAVSVNVTESTESTAPVEADDISDDEFESLLDALGGDETVGTPVPKNDDITESEFDELLDKLHGEGTPSGTEPSKNSKPESVKNGHDGPPTGDEITEDEFENLLNELHQGGAPGQSKSDAKAESKPEEKASTVAENSSLISEDEFESMLDTLHGDGKSPSKNDDSKTAASKEAPKADRKPKVKAPAAKAQPAKKETPAAKPADDKQNAPIVQETTVRVDTKRLDDIMNMVGELVLVRNRLVRLGLQSEDESMGKAVANLDVVTGDLQNAVMKTRMQPIKKVFGRFPRVVRDLARSLKKEIDLELRGEDTDLDKNLVEALADPLVHLVRNSVDHGIEGPDEREASGKPRVGKVILSAEQEGDHILLSIEDDGAGMDAVKLRQIAVTKGLMDADAAERLSDEEAFNLIFAPGFSSKVEITDVSGRGVGMDVVKTKISQLNGTLDIKSVLGKGSRFSIKVPLTLAIMPTLMVMLSDQAFAFPLVSVNEIFHLNLKKTNIVDGQQVVVIRGKTLPIFHLKHWLIKGETADMNPEEAHIVVVQVGMSEVGFIVDQLVGQEEVVIKPLGKMLQGTAGMSGATITGDGRIALILDVPSMLKSYASS